MKKLFATVVILCLGVTGVQAHSVSVDVGVRVGSGVVYDAPYDGYRPAPRRRIRPHCARQDVHCWWNDDYQRVCHRHRRNSCYWYYR